jgi:guanine deaminase
MIAGKVMMDRGAPEALRDTVKSSYDHSKALIEHWHGKERQRYAVTPRFAITSTPAQLEAAGALLIEHPGVYLQTHLSETQSEIDLAKSLYPGSEDYAGIYQSFGLLGPRSLMGHCLHLSPREQARLAETGTVAVLCPTSNLFLGSGLADRAGLESNFIRTGLATDVGAGTSYSMLRTAAEAYKVEQLRGRSLPAHDAFRWITRGNAEALGLEDEIGSIEVGRYADLVVLDSSATSAMAHRMERCESLEEELFVLLTLGDDRAVAATYVQGQDVIPPAHPAPRSLRPMT